MVKAKIGVFLYPNRSAIRPAAQAQQSRPPGCCTEGGVTAAHLQFAIVLGLVGGPVGPVEAAKACFGLIAI